MPLAADYLPELVSRLDSDAELLYAHLQYRPNILNGVEVGAHRRPWQLSNAEGPQCGLHACCSVHGTPVVLIDEHAVREGAVQYVGNQVLLNNGLIRFAVEPPFHTNQRPQSMYGDTAPDWNAVPPAAEDAKHVGWNEPVNWKIFHCRALHTSS